MAELEMSQNHSGRTKMVYPKPERLLVMELSILNMTEKQILRHSMVVLQLLEVLNIVSQQERHTLSLLMAQSPVGWV